ncbi:Archaic translocase outer mitochondrial membrane 46 kDa subunit [Novymonas esmeraldas]|uniref:Archaic translocase outer mitochondrial membrane 46 kDa subunit n=1 Tax=Novymonas esmeraldas TaxID=1808958 RepID=A0AAW0F6Q9_9TRYP
MESPINPAVWQVLFNAAIGAISVATLYSVYHQKADMEASQVAAFHALRKADTEEARVARLTELQAACKPDAVRRQPATRMSALKHGAPIVLMARLMKDGSNVASVRAAVKVILYVYGPDAAGRQKLNSLDGYKVLLTTLSEAQRQGEEELMEDVAQALDALTQVDDSEVVLDTDVPEGSEGAATLARLPATAKMLRILDPEGSVTFLASLTGIFSNICALADGAATIGAGVDEHSGMSFFLRLLDHSNRRVVANAVTVVRFLARAHIGQEELIEEENLVRLADNLQVTAEPAIVNSILTVILVMAGSTKYGEAFFSGIASSSIPTTLFELWVRSPEKALRNRAEVLSRLLLRIPQTAPVVAALFERFRGQVEERRRRDEEEYKQQMQQMQQNQMMQRMMMEQMGMDPSMMG